MIVLMLYRYINVSDQWIPPSPQPYSDQVMYTLSVTIIMRYLYSTPYKIGQWR